MEEMAGRVVSLLVGVVLVLTLGGCGAGEPSSTPTGITQTGADVRERLAAGLAAVGSDAEMVRDMRTTLTPVEATWLHGWQVFDLQLSTEYRSSRFYAALSDDGRTLDLYESPESFAEMTRSAKVAVNDASLAVDVGNLYLDVTRDFRKWSYRIDSLSDVQWRPDIDSDLDLQQQRADLEARYADVVQPPTARASETGWSVTVWMVYDRSLVRHSLEIAVDGAVQDRPEVVETDMPVPYSL